MKIARDMTELIGNTPLVRINKITKDAYGQVVAKLEKYNPMSSVKDRIAMAMIEDAMARGILKEGATVVEPTSGNTGIGLAFICAIKGFRLILTMPDTMSIERRKLLKSLGAEIVLTNGKLGMKGAIEKANEIVKNTPGAFMPQQFKNPANPKIHEKTTGIEIWNDTDGKIDILIAGVGTGGTITGAGRYLKQKKNSIKLVAIEPLSSPVLSGGQAGPHKIQGIGAGFIPDVLDTSLIDEIIKVSDEEAFEMSKRLAKEEGIFVGISSGAAMSGALKIAHREENKDKLIVVIFPDTGERYLSIDM